MGQVVRNRKKKGVNYWNEIEEQLVIDLKNETDVLIKTKLINKLMPALRMMVQGIMRRYYSTYYHQSEERVVMNDCYTKVIMSLDGFNPERAKAFAYCQTIIKNHLHSIFVVITKNKRGHIDTMRNNVDDIPDDANKYMVHHEKGYEIDIVSAKDRMLSLIKSKLKKLEDDNKYGQFTRNERSMIRGIVKTGSLQYITNRIDLLKGMIEYLETNDILSYERFIIEAYLSSKLTVNAFNRTLKKLGFTFDNVFGIIYDYEGVSQAKEGWFDPDPDYLMNDIIDNVEHYVKEYHRKKMKFKRILDDD